MTEMTKRMILFSGSVNPELAEEIAKYLNVNLGNIKHEQFANGEIYARYQESIRGADVFLIQSVCASETFDVNDALMELLIMADAAKRASARSISAVIAHYGYARQDRKAAPREPITAKLVADLLEVSGIDNIITVDLHQDAIQGFFDIPVNHMTAMPIFVDYFRNKGFDPERLCVVSPDVGLSLIHIFVQIDLLGHDFFAYTDRDTNLVHILYRREDGGYGLLTQKED